MFFSGSKMDWHALQVFWEQDTDVFIKAIRNGYKHSEWQGTRKARGQGNPSLFTVHILVPYKNV
jgi:hypothetical protein